MAFTPLEHKELQLTSIYPNQFLNSFLLTWIHQQSIESITLMLPLKSAYFASEQFPWYFSHIFLTSTYWIRFISKCTSLKFETSNKIMEIKISTQGPCQSCWFTHTKLHRFNEVCPTEWKARRKLMTSVFDTSRHMECRFDKRSLGNTHQRGFLLWSLMLIAI